ncbi:MAG: hypothetical protein ACRD2L_00035 [Terriglobia bacterium]
MNTLCTKDRRGKFVKFLSLMGSLLVFSGTAAALSVNPNQPVTSVGAQGNIPFFKWASIPSCLYGVMYLDSHFSTDPLVISRAVNLITVAYLSGKPIMRVDYNRDAANVCHLTLFEF